MVKVQHALIERVEIDAEAGDTPPPPADALATFDPPQPPAIVELVPLSGERTGLAMLSYTRLARDHAAAAIAAGNVRETIDADEFDADDGDDTGDTAGTQHGAPRTAAAPQAGDLPGGATTGQFLHGVLEDLDLAGLRRAASFDDWRADEAARAVIEARAREYAIDPVYLPAAAKLVYSTLCDPLALTDGNTLPALADATAIAREVEFSYPVPGTPPRALVKGFIDALVAYDDELWVLDYKSDRLDGADLAQTARAHVDEHYLVQARLYALAADRLRGGRRVAGLLYSFIRYGIVVALRIEHHTLEDWASWLAALPVEIAR
jgi:exodeoxyribonuclease V beta subunit